MKKDDEKYMDEKRQVKILEVFLMLEDIMFLIEQNIATDYKTILSDALKEIEKLTTDEDIVWGERLKMDYDKAFDIFMKECEEEEKREIFHKTT